MNEQDNQNQKAVELLPCPWCRVVPLLVESPLFGGEVTSFRVSCDEQDCLINPQTPISYVKGDVFSWWNDRVPPSVSEGPRKYGDLFRALSIIANGCEPGTDGPMKRPVMHLIDGREMQRIAQDAINSFHSREKDASTAATLLVPEKPDLRKQGGVAVKEAPITKMTLFPSLRRANVARQSAWCPEQQPDLSFRGNELAGETGEVCNVIKKLERERQGWRGSRDTTEHLAEELADVVICADLIGIAAGIDLDAAVIAKFNATSEEVGLPHRIAPSAEPQRPKSDAGSGVPQNQVNPSAHCVLPEKSDAATIQPSSPVPAPSAHNVEEWRSVWQLGDLIVLSGESEQILRLTLPREEVEGAIDDLILAHNAALRGKRGVTKKGT